MPSLQQLALEQRFYHTEKNMHLFFLSFLPVSNSKKPKPFAYLYKMHALPGFLAFSLDKDKERCHL